MTVHEQMERANALVAELESGAPLPVLEAAGQLIRPTLVLAGAAQVDDRVLLAAAAVQYAHEASLIHDDIIDQAPLRRGQPALHQARGFKTALVQGDHVLTTGYRAAAQTGSIAFVQAFARAVERTVAGEIEQGRRRGEWLDDATYEGIVARKSGALLGCSLAAGALLEENASAEQVYGLGVKLGVLYQRIDDLLDFIPEAATGKAPLSDYEQQKWTWPLSELAVRDFTLPAVTVSTLLFQRDASGFPMKRCLARLQSEAAALVRAAEAALPGAAAVRALVQGWLGQVHAAVLARPAVGASAAQWLAQNAPATSDWGSYFARNSKSFRFAARWFRPNSLQKVAALYAFCRFTDDLADTVRPASEPAPSELLEAWESALRQSYDGSPSGIGLIDRIAEDLRSHDVPLEYPLALIEGMRMDLRGESYASMTELNVYTYRVAGVIGQWLTRLWGIHDPWLLERATELGHAMQLTNIVRDVVEDLERGRMYVPADAMARHGVTRDELEQNARTGSASHRYQALLEELMSNADRAYERAQSALSLMPPDFARAAAVAGHVYRGIHDQVRRNAYDGRIRASTSGARKVWLGFNAIRALRA